jgi:galactoside O-acetyltransferase
MILREMTRWAEAAATWMPGGLGRRARAAWWRRRLAALGAAPCLEAGLAVTGPQNISLGERFTIARGGALHAEDGRLRVGRNASFNCNVFLSASEGGEIEIGDDVLIGPNAVLRASDHRFDDPSRPVRSQGHRGGRITVGDDVWIGANAVLVAGAEVGAHAIVAAGAVVVKPVAPWTIVGGVPAREIGRRARPGDGT